MQWYGRIRVCTRKCTFRFDVLVNIFKNKTKQKREIRQFCKNKLRCTELNSANRLTLPHCEQGHVWVRVCNDSTCWRKLLVLAKADGHCWHWYSEFSDDLRLHPRFCCSHSYLITFSTWAVNSMFWLSISSSWFVFWAVFVKDKKIVLTMCTSLIICKFDTGIYMLLFMHVYLMTNWNFGHLRLKNKTSSKIVKIKSELYLLIE